jgi:hypothetical protein
MAGWRKFQGWTLENLRQQLNTDDALLPVSLAEAQEHLHHQEDTLFPMVAPHALPQSPQQEEQGQDTLLWGETLTPGSTAWSVTLHYIEGAFLTQWYLSYSAGGFPFALGTLLWFEGNYYLLLSTNGSRSLKLLALCSPLHSTDDPQHHVASISQKRGPACKRARWSKRAQSLKPVPPLRAVEAEAPHPRMFASLSARFVYRVAVEALPDDLYFRLPEGARYCYVRLFCRPEETGYFATVAPTPDLSHARAVALEMHDALLVASLIQDAKRSSQEDHQALKMLPVYLLPPALRRKVRSSLSFLLPTASSGQAAHPSGKRAAGAPCSYASTIGELTQEHLALIRAWSQTAADVSAELFDYVYLTETGEVTDDGLHHVEVAALADRLLGKQSGQIYDCWLDAATLQQALAWTSAFDHAESHMRRVRVMAFALSRGARRAIQQEIKQALPHPRSPEKEEPVWLVSQNIHLPESLVQPLLETVEQNQKKRLKGLLPPDLRQSDLLDVAHRALQRQCDERHSRGLDATWHQEMLAFLDAGRDWLTWCREKKPRIIAFSTSTETEIVERPVEITVYTDEIHQDDTQHSKPRMKRCVLGHRLELRTKPRSKPTSGYDLVIGVPVSDRILSEIEVDLEVICQVPRKEKENPSMTARVRVA